MSQSELAGFRSWLRWSLILKIRDGLSYESSIFLLQRNPAIRNWERGSSLCARPVISPWPARTVPARVSSIRMDVDLSFMDRVLKPVRRGSGSSNQQFLTASLTWPWRAPSGRQRWSRLRPLKRSWKSVKHSMILTIRAHQALSPIYTVLLCDWLVYVHIIKYSLK